ncbi:MAG: hypothetical protein RIS64_787 [Bacteroidota bacterium]
MHKRTAKILKRCLHGLFVAATYTGATAQDTSKPAIDSTAKPVMTAVTDTAMVKLPDTYFQTPHWGLGLTVGSNALFGLDVAYSINPMFTVKLGYNYLDLAYKNLTPVFKSIKLPAELGGEVNMQQSHLALTAEFTPTRSKKLRLAVGGVFFLKNEISGNIFYTKDLQLNDMVITASEVGSMKGTYTTASKIAPYIGVGFGRTVPKKRIGLNLDLGAIYKGVPMLDIQATGLLKGNESNEAILNRNFKPLQWHPVLNLRLAVKLN